MVTTVTAELAKPLDWITNEKPSWIDHTDHTWMVLPDDGHHYEVINGSLKDRGLSGALHGYVCSLLLSALMNYVFAHKLGVMLDSSTAFKMKNGNKRSPDLAFFAKERLQGLTQLPNSFLEGAPDLAVEVLSPGNTYEEIDDKITEYFDNGCRLIWVINPSQHYVLVYSSTLEPDRLLKSEDQLDGGEVIPGFQYSVAQLFQPLSF